MKNVVTVELVFILIKYCYNKAINLIDHYFKLLLLFIVQCWTQASKPELLKQDTQEEKYN